MSDDGPIFGDDETIGIDAKAHRPARAAILRNTLRWWLRQPYIRRLALQNYRIYWKYAHWRNKAAFHTQRIRYLVRGHLVNARESASVLGAITKEITFHCCLALFVAAALELIERRVLWSFSSLDLKPLADGIASRKEIYTTLFSTLAQIAGVFIGLYFAGICTIMSSAYVKVPSDVRRLMLEEKTGSVYIRIVAYLGVVSLAAVAAQSFGFHAGVLVVALTCLLGLLSLLSFVVLSTHIFAFYDLPVLGYYASRKLFQMIGLASGKRSIGLNPSFQHHFQQRAEALVTTYQSIVTISTTTDYSHLRGMAIRQLGSRALQLCRHYSQVKKTIPSSSRWFRAELEQPSWLTADATAIQVAVATSTGIQADIKNDTQWLERELNGIAFTVLDALVNRGDAIEVAGMCNELQQTVGVLALNGNIDAALRLLGTIASIADRHALATASLSSTGDSNTKQLRITLTLIDMHATGFLGALLGYYHYLKQLGEKAIDASVRAIDWADARAIYAMSPALSVTEQLEWLKERLTFEQAVEGKVITPLWCQNQLVALHVARDAKARLEQLSAEFGKVICQRAEQLNAGKVILAATQLVVRGLEACRKADTLLDGAAQFFADLNKTRLVKDIPWSEADTPTLRASVSRYHDDLVTTLAAIAPLLAKTEPDSKLPDYFGNAYTVLAVETHSALASGKVELFGKLFPSYFMLALSAGERIAKTVEDRTIQAKMVYQTEALVDLFHLSGYALIYGELLELPFAAMVRRMWDVTIKHHPNPEGYCKYLAQVARVRESTFVVFTPRVELRGHWQLRLAAELRKRGLARERLHYSPSFGGKKILHKSLMVQCLGSHWSGRDDPDAIFLSEYLFSLPELNGEELPREVAEWRDKMQRRRDRQPKSVNEAKQELVDTDEDDE